MFKYQKEYKDDYDEKKERKNTCELYVKGIIGLFNFVTLILLIVWLCIIINNANEEPKSFDSFFSNESPLNYTEGDFCYGRKYEFSKNGLFKVFHIRMKEIKKYSIGLLVSKLISFLMIICAAGAIIAYEKSTKGSYADKNMIIFAIIYTILYIINSILNVVFFELLSHNFSDSNFEDFETFSNCAYLTRKFKRKYDFINTVKNNCERISVVNLISTILEALNVF